MISPTRLMAVNQSEKPRLNQFNDLYVNEESSVIDQGFSENWGGGAHELTLVLVEVQAAFSSSCCTMHTS